MKNHGLLFIVSGPAGSGKTTLANSILQSKKLDLHRVVTTTTRPPRKGEIDGDHYHFLSKEAFQSHIWAGNLYEYAQVHAEHFYGTLKADIEPLLQTNIDLLLVIDVQGAKTFRQCAQTDKYLKEHLVTVFLKLEHAHMLKERLIKRSTDSEWEIERRLQSAQEELSQEPFFDHTLISTSPEADLANFQTIFDKEKFKRNLLFD